MSRDSLSDEERSRVEAYTALLATRRLLDTMATETERALNANPSEAEEIRLQALKLDIAGQRTVVQEKITLMERNDSGIPLPPPAAVAKVSAMVERVERETKAAAQTEATIKLAADVAALARELAG